MQVQHVHLRAICQLRFYLEIQVQEKSQMDKELEYRKHVADARPLMKRCQGMQSLISFGTC